jgi:hypothetical protein
VVVHFLHTFPASAYPTALYYQTTSHSSPQLCHMALEIWSDDKLLCWTMDFDGDMEGCIGLRILHWNTYHFPWDDNLPFQALVPLV